MGATSVCSIGRLRAGHFDIDTTFVCVSVCVNKWATSWTDSSTSARYIAHPKLFDANEPELFTSNQTPFICSCRLQLHFSFSKSTDGDRRIQHTWLSSDCEFHPNATIGWISVEFSKVDAHRGRHSDEIWIWKKTSDWQQMKFARKKKKQMTSVGGAYLSCAHSSRDLFEWDKSVKCVVISLLFMAATWNLCACRPMNAI